MRVKSTTLKVIEGDKVCRKTALNGTAFAEIRLVPVGKAWAQNTVNANILRHDSVVTHENEQYVAYYDADGFVILAKRKLGSEEWETKNCRIKTYDSPYPNLTGPNHRAPRGADFTRTMTRHRCP